MIRNLQQESWRSDERKGFKTIYAHRFDYNDYMNLKCHQSMIHISMISKN
jgi:hypothetical protein